jgi:hypothetical protein
VILSHLDLLVERCQAHHEEPHAGALADVLIILGIRPAMLDQHLQAGRIA